MIATSSRRSFVMTPISHSSGVPIHDHRRTDEYLDSTLAETEKQQLGLLATSPVTSSVVLRGKLVLLAAPFLWTFIVIAIGAPWIAAVSTSGNLCFVALGIPVVLSVSAFSAIVSTQPVLFEIEGPLANSVRAIAPVLIIMGGISGLIAATIATKSQLANVYRDAANAPDGTMVHAVVIGVAWLGGAVIAVVAWRLGARNLEKLLAPKR